MAASIFDDLEIDFSTMLTDPEPFYKSCVDAAAELKSIMRGNTSIASHIAKAPKFDGSYAEYNKMMVEIWHKASEELPVSAYFELAKRMRKVAADIEYLAQSKAAQELAETTHVMDKATAHAQYKRLREALNQWLEAVKIFNVFEGEKLEPMSGNFGGDRALVHYMFFFGEGDDEYYRNHLAVCRKIGIDIHHNDGRPMSLMDVVEYVEAHPELGITVKQITS